MTQLSDRVARWARQHLNRRVRTRRVSGPSRSSAPQLAGAVFYHDRAHRRLRSWGTSGRAPRSLTPAGVSRLSSSLSTLRSFPSRPRGRTVTQDSLPAGGQPLPDGGRYPARSLVNFQPRLHGILLIQGAKEKRTAKTVNLRGRGADGSAVLNPSLGRSSSGLAENQSARTLVSLVHAFAALSRWSCAHRPARSEHTRAGMSRSVDVNPYTPPTGSAELSLDAPSGGRNKYRYTATVDLARAGIRPSALFAY
jgi:hypothetical protein